MRWADENFRNLQAIRQTMKKAFIETLRIEKDDQLDDVTSNFVSGITGVMNTAANLPDVI